MITHNLQPDHVAVTGEQLRRLLRKAPRDERVRRFTPLAEARPVETLLRPRLRFWLVSVTFAALAGFIVAGL